MYEFQQLVEERDRILLASLEEERVEDYSKLRSICRKFNERCVTEDVFDVQGTDQQLWESVNTYFRKLLKKS